MKFERGYEPIRKRLLKGSYFKSCYNCGSFYRGVGDKEELCQDISVSSFDMIINEHQIYCTQWRPSFDTDDEKPTIFKRGRIEK